ncbi:cation-translocating P-type ATPase [Halobacterium sp. R2-5]|uniref:heavy metal translocating P-type ATPase n=1 Tax=Halobacterium sp. R2-5 TaxID=2715751 RepID=UPI001423F27C|nr:cation-translocating P-type ATPase [Halobacterium sp. R2-5]NIB98027.1 cation-translocating P-type ATPase [Halobacterium sp. R2-5]
MSCTLCGLPTPDRPVTAADVDGEYCCRGCLEVARSTDAPADADAEAAADALDRGADPDDADGETAFLSVSGMHCATCEAFVESRATSHDGVLAASASYPTESVKLTYDPSVVDRDGLTDTVDGLGYSAGEREVGERDDDVAVGRLLVGGFFGMMTMLWYVLFLYPVYLGVSPENLLVDLSGSAGAYLFGNVWLMATVVLGYTGYPLFRGAFVSVRAGRPNMDLLVGVAAAAAYAYSTVVVLGGGTDVYYDVAVVIVLAVTVGDYYEDRVKRGATTRLADLTADRVDDAVRRTADGTETVSVDDLDAGDEVVVASGDRVPVDGVVAEGTAVVDESLVTGESRPVRRSAGDDAVGGSVLREGRLVVRVGEDAASTLDRVVRALWDVQSTRPGAQRLADRVAAVFVPLVVVLASAATAWHLFAGAAPDAALLVGLSVLVVSCPCALGLATPLAVARGVREALDDGVVVTDASAFEAAPDADVVAFDKTGTLTTGEMRVRDWRGDDRVPPLAAAVEQYADHPVAAAIADDADAADVDVVEFERVPGDGVTARVADGDRERTVLAGRAALFDARDWTVPEEFAARAEAAREAGDVPVLVGWDGRAEGVVVAGDEPRAEWRDVVTALSEDRRVVVLTGDDRAAAATFRDHPGVDEVFAGVPPEGKTEVVRRLARDETVAMVGDGVNDAPALAAADLGVALDHTALAADAADAVVTTDDLGAVPRAFDLLRATNGRITQNLGWAFLYNAVAVPLAVAGVLNPLFAAAAMATSSLLVVGNSTRSLLGDDRDGDADARDAGRVEVHSGEVVDA